MDINALTHDKTDSKDIRLAEDVLKELVKAKKTIRLYPQNNPMYTNALDAVYDRFNRFFKSCNKLTLSIYQRRITYDQTEIYYNPDDDDNFALFLFKDGLRELSFLNTLTRNELETFCRIINIDFQEDAPDDDIVTLLWESDFKHIRYFVDEDFLGDWEITNDKNISDDALARAHEDALKKETEESKVTINLTDDDLRYFAEEINRQRQPKLHKLITIYFELLHQTKGSSDNKALIHIIKDTINHCVSDGDFGNAAYIMDNLDAVIKGNSFDSVERGNLNTIYNMISSKVFIDKIGKVLDLSTEIDGNDFQSFIDHLDEKTILFFLQLLGRLQTIRARHRIIDCLITLGARDIKAVAGGLRDNRWFVVRNTVLILGKIDSPSSLEYIVKGMDHSDQRVRKEAVRALGDMQNPEAVLHLGRTLHDSNQGVRIAAARALSHIDTADSKQLLLSELSKKSFNTKSFSEKKELYKSIATWHDRDIKNLLYQTLKKKKFFRRAKHDENKACCAYALGIMRDRESLEILKAAARSKNIPVRKHAEEAIKKITS